MSRASQDHAVRLVVFAAAAVMMAGVALVGFAVVEGRGTGGFGHALACAVGGGDDGEPSSGAGSGPDC